MRLAEMAQLRVADVNLTQRVIHITTAKFSRDRVVPLGTIATERLRQYVNPVRSAWVTPTESIPALWLAGWPPHHPIAAPALARIVRCTARAAGIRSPVGPHVWRHTCATFLVRRGAPLPYVQLLLGHRSLNTTQLYARVAVCDLQRTSCARIRAHRKGISMSPLRSSIAEYRQHLESHHYSLCTVRNLMAHLHHFRKFLDARRIRRPAQVDEAVLRKYQFWLHQLPTQRGAPRTAATLNRGLSAVKGLFQYLHESGQLTSSPARALVYAREPQPLPRNVLSPDEAKCILEHVDLSTPFGYRDRTILEVLYATGIRKNELTHAQLGDLNLEDELLTVRQGKGGRDRVVPLSAVACRYIAHYIRHARPHLLNGEPTETLFLSAQGRTLGATTVSELIHKTAARAGIRSRVTCHLWRHTVATHMLQNGANLLHVQEMLGHRKLETTQRYLHLTILDLKQAHHRYHPRELDVARSRAKEQNGNCEVEKVTP